MQAIVLDPTKVVGVVFDLDGTLVDSYEAIAESANRALLAVGLDRLPVDEIRRRVGRGLESLMADLVGVDHAERAVRVFREVYAEAWPTGTRALPGVPETLRTLRARGYRMAVASNKPARFAHPILEGLGLSDLFEAVEGPDTAGSTKPDPILMRRCLAAVEAEPDHALYVGDMVLDVETANRAGVPVVLVQGGSSSLAELQRTGRPLLPSISDLLDLLPGAPLHRLRATTPPQTEGLPPKGDSGYKSS